VVVLNVSTGRLRKQPARTRRSLNKEALVWLQRQADEAAQAKPMSAAEAAKKLRAWKKLLTPGAHREFAEAVEQGVALM
jgi:hypothetical protein